MSRPRLKKWAIRAGQIVLGLVVGLVVTEAVFWWRDDGAFPHLNLYRPDATLGVRLVPGTEQRLAFGGNPVTSIRINRDGYRGANLPAPSSGRDEILIVGDSQVFGLGVEEGQTFSARLGARLGKEALVVNGGVPTYGPAEYQAVVAEMLERRQPRTVVFTLNMVNDLFEVSRPNVARHAVWDGWAVRKESSPGQVTWFPGRHFLFNRSHAFFALRRWWHSRGPDLDDRGFASEGTWEDVARVGNASKTQHAEAGVRARTRLDEQGGAAAKLEASEDALDRAMRQQLPDLEYRELQAARANPGDILSVGNPNAEASRSTYATAAQISRGAAYRAKAQAELLAKAKARGDQAILDAFATRDGLQRQLALLDLATDAAAIESPLAPTLRQVKALCDRAGARLVVLVLPIDVQVSAEEWKKYGKPARDMSDTLVLIDDVMASAAAMGVTAVDATRPLAAAEPGAFLNADIHMTPKGHQAVADALAAALATPPPPPRLRGASARSNVPLPSVWKAAPEITVAGSTAAGCETKRVREWLRVACRRDDYALFPSDLTVVSGDGGEAMTLVTPGATTLVVPLVAGQELVVDFGWTRHTRRLTARWPAEVATPALAFTEPVVRPTALTPTYDFLSGTEAKICTCWQEAYGESTCNGAYGAADAACVATFASDCTRMLACIRRDPASEPPPVP